MSDWLQRLIGRGAPNSSPSAAGDTPQSSQPIRGNASPAPEPASLRAVPGALVATAGGAVIYNLLTPHMQQFMGRSVGTLKRAGVKAKGTAQFSVLVGDPPLELRLDRFYQPNDDPALIDAVVAAAQGLLTSR